MTDVQGIVVYDRCFIHRVSTAPASGGLSGSFEAPELVGEFEHKILLQHLSSHFLDVVGGYIL
jgi:hypothetical protein